MHTVRSTLPSCHPRTRIVPLERPVVIVVDRTVLLNNPFVTGLGTDDDFQLELSMLDDPILDSRAEINKELVELGCVTATVDSDDREAPNTVDQLRPMPFEDPFRLALFDPAPLLTIETGRLVPQPSVTGATDVVRTDEVELFVVPATTMDPVFVDVDRLVTIVAIGVPVTFHCGP